MIIFPVDGKFDRMTGSEQDEELSVLGFQANRAGLRAAAFAVWGAGAGRMGFLGPQQWHPFLQGLSLRLVMAKLNKEISW